MPLQVNVGWAAGEEVEAVGDIEAEGFLGFEEREVEEDATKVAGTASRTIASFKKKDILRQDDSYQRRETDWEQARASRGRRSVKS